MLKLLKKTEEKECLAFCSEQLEGAVIYTRLKAYGSDGSEALFWLSRDSKNKINAVCSMLDGVFTYCSDNTADEEEIIMFAHIMGASEITKKGKYILKFESSPNIGTASDISGENLKDAFPVIFEDEPCKNIFFSKWYTDASYKIRHSLIHGKAVFDGKKCISAALTSGESDKIAVISSVATLKEYRKQGYGENVVISLAKSLDKTVYLMTDDEQIAHWYEKMGFILDN